MLQLEPFTEDQGRPAVQPLERVPARQLPCAFRVSAPVDSHACQTPWSVFQDGRWGAHWPMPRSRVYPAGHADGARHVLDRIDGIPRTNDPSGLRPSMQTASIRTPSRAADRLTAVPHPTESFSSFPRGTCSLSVSRPYLALDGIYRPIGAAFPNNPTRRQRLVVRQGPSRTGLSPSPAPLSRGLGPGPSLRTLLQTTIRTTQPPDSQAGLIPRVAPPDLGSRSVASTRTTTWVLEASPGSRRHDVRLAQGIHHASCSTTTDGPLFGQPHPRARGAILRTRLHPPRGGHRRSVESVTPRQACP
ncbi:hypothetical protein C4D60_Mb00t00540 [Musa balbisiana]|uniref:Uncharacterized protein n=1 Tax=Musa balbisiana TaxID=52838 RepID=A0A4S8I770_MUSBA|nr:hypothetical protein C4D60_Mb00t00540 [Musa balbisiana]